MRLIDADALKEEVKTIFCPDGYKIMMMERIDNAPAVTETQGKWFDHIEKGLLKARYGDYVLYQVDYLLDNLAREVYFLEGAIRAKGGAE